MCLGRKLSLTIQGKMPVCFLTLLRTAGIKALIGHHVVGIVFRVLWINY